jgi:WD40 repeat protein
MLAVGFTDGAIVFADGLTGKALRRLVLDDPVNSIAFSPDGRLLAAATRSDQLTLVNVDHGKPLHTFKGHQRPITSVAFFPDGGRIASGSLDTTVRVGAVK